MRVEGRSESPAAERTPGAFDDALTRARGTDAAQNTRRADRADHRPAPKPAARPRIGHDLPGREERGTSPASPGREAVDPAPVPEVAAVARAAPPVVAARGPAGGPLALSFGPSLAVELREAPAGVAVLLRADPRLARAAEAELPRLVAALRVRGVSVARAEVGGPPRPVDRGPSGGPGGRGRAR